MVKHPFWLLFACNYPSISRRNQRLYMPAMIWALLTSCSDCPCVHNKTKRKTRETPCVRESKAHSRCSLRVLLESGASGWWRGASSRFHSSGARSAPRRAVVTGRCAFSAASTVVSGASVKTRSSNRRICTFQEKFIYKIILSKLALV